MSMPDFSQHPAALINARGLVLLTLWLRPAATQREIAGTIGVTVRTVARALVDLEEAGYLSRAGRGRSVRCTIAPEVAVRGPGVSTTVGDFLRAVSVAKDSTWDVDLET